MTRRMLVAGNWKMNGLAADRGELDALIPAASALSCEVILCPPATLIAGFAEIAGGTAVGIGAQDCHAAAKGAHTGDLSAAMLSDAGAGSVIVGHSERRTDHGERDEDVRAKAAAVLGAGMVAVICVGETEAERDAGDTLDVVSRQVSGSLPDGVTAENTVIAYEPVWAIGTGRTPTLEQIAEVHDHLRSVLAGLVGAGSADGIRLLYGGSVKPDNAAGIFALENVDGALVGGASLKAADFSRIARAAG